MVRSTRVPALLSICAVIALSSCDGPTPAEPFDLGTQGADEITAPLFAKGGKVKPPTLPSDCTDGGLVRWDAATASFVCATLTGGVTHEITVTSQYWAPGNNFNLDAFCPAGEIVTGGGFLMVNHGTFDVEHSVPLYVGGQSGWRIQATATLGGVITAYAVCMTPVQVQ